MFSRREFLMSATALGMAGCSASESPSNSVSSGETLKEIGVQLYTVRDAFQLDPESTLKKVRNIGYNFVEFGGGGYDQMDHTLLRGVMDDLGLKTYSAHIDIKLIMENLTPIIKMSKTLGVDYLIIPWVDETYRSVDGYQKLGEMFTTLGKRLREDGLNFAYHNHEFEFDTFDVAGEMQTGMDLILTNSDPAYVDMELDFFWAAKAGIDIPAFFRKYPGRCKLAHVKDMAANGDMVSVGDGQIDFEAYMALKGVSGIQHYIAEHDNPADPFGSITTSYATMKNMNF